MRRLDQLLAVAREVRRHVVDDEPENVRPLNIGRPGRGDDHCDGDQGSARCKTANHSDSLVVFSGILRACEIKRIQHQCDCRPGREAPTRIQGGLARAACDGSIRRLYSRLQQFPRIGHLCRASRHRCRLADVASADPTGDVGDYSVASRYNSTMTIQISRKHNVLVLCTGNSCRSQIAEGYLRHHAGDRYNVYTPARSPRNRFTRWRSR